MEPVNDMNKICTFSLNKIKNLTKRRYKEKKRNHSLAHFSFMAASVGMVVVLKELLNILSNDWFYIVGILKLLFLFLILFGGVSIVPYLYLSSFFLEEILITDDQIFFRDKFLLKRSIQINDICSFELEIKQSKSNIGAKLKIIMKDQKQINIFANNDFYNELIKSGRVD